MDEWSFESERQHAERAHWHDIMDEEDADRAENLEGNSRAEALLLFGG